MKTWSLADVMDVFKRVERITRPPRRNAFDEDLAGEFLAVSPDGYYGYAEPNLDEIARPPRRRAGAEQLAEREAAEEVGEPRPVCACCFQRERGEGTCLCGYCTERGVDPGYYSRHEAPVPSVADIMSPGRRAREQSTLDDVVAQLCQLTYFVEDLRNIIRASPAASTAGDSGQPVDSFPPSPGCPRSPSKAATSALLTDAARVLEAMTGSELVGSAWSFDGLIRDLRDRAEVFKGVEDE